MFRNELGEEITMQEAQGMVRDGRVEVGHDVFELDGHEMLIRTRLQPIHRRNRSPLFLTNVRGDRELGPLEYGSDTEEEAIKVHKFLVVRYQTIEAARQEGIHRVLLPGVL